MPHDAASQHGGNPAAPLAAPGEVSQAATAVPRSGEGLPSLLRKVALLVFTIGSERFAIELAAVREIGECGAARFVPGWNGAARGLLAIGGRLLPLVSAGALLGLEGGYGGAALVMQAGGVALEVDEVEEVLEVELERLLPPPLGTPAGDPLAAVVSEQGSLVAVLDAGTLVQAALQAVPR